MCVASLIPATRIFDFFIVSVFEWRLSMFPATLGCCWDHGHHPEESLHLCRYWHWRPLEQTPVLWSAENTCLRHGAMGPSVVGAHATRVFLSFSLKTRTLHSCVGDECFNLKFSGQTDPNRWDSTGLVLHRFDPRNPKELLSRWPGAVQREEGQARVEEEGLEGRRHPPEEGPTKSTTR